LSHRRVEEKKHEIFPTGYSKFHVDYITFNPLKVKLSPTCHLLALLGAHHILHVSSIMVNHHREKLAKIAAQHFLGKLSYQVAAYKIEIQLKALESKWQVQGVCFILPI